MRRVAFVFLLASILMIAGIVSAIKILPLWASLSLLVGLPVVAIVALYMGRGKILGMILSIPFRLKGQALRNATVTVHSVQSIPVPSGDADADSRHEEKPIAMDYYELEATVFPKKAKGPFLFWEPLELRLFAKPRFLYRDDDACRIVDLDVVDDPSLDDRRKRLAGITTGGVEITEVEVGDCAPKSDNAMNHEDGNEVDNWDDEDDNEDGDRDDEEHDDKDTGCKYFGPQRLRLKFGIKPGVHKLVFQYYFEKFGSVAIPR